MLTINYGAQLSPNYGGYWKCLFVSHSNWPSWCFLLMRGHHIHKKGFPISLCTLRPRRKCKYITSQGGGQNFFVWLFCFVFFFELQNSKIPLDLFPLAYLWCKNAVRLNVHLEGLSWRSWAREFVMGTNDGFRNFSANCDLERSTSTDRHAGLSWGSQGSH